MGLVERPGWAIESPGNYPKKGDLPNKKEAKKWTNRRVGNWTLLRKGKGSGKSFEKGVRDRGGKRRNSTIVGVAVSAAKEKSKLGNYHRLGKKGKEKLRWESIDP